MLSAYSRVTVVGQGRSVDLALPSGLPLADVVPQVLRFCVPADGIERPEAWALARLGGPVLGLGHSLGESGVVDGDVLELRRTGADVRPAVVEDVRDAVEDSVDAAGGVWTASATLTYALAGGAILLGLLAVGWLLPLGTLGLGAVRDAVRPPDEGARLGAAAASVAVLLGSCAVAARTVPAWVGQTCAAVAMVWGALLGAALTDVVGTGDDRLVLMAGGVALAAAAARAVHPATTAHVAAAAALVVPAVAVRVVQAFDVSALQVLRAAPVLALLAVGVLPRVSLSVGGLASADYRVRSAGRMSASALRARYRESNGLLVGGLLAASALVLVGGGVLAVLRPGVWDPWLVASLGIVAVLRSRVFSRVGHVLPLRVSGTLVLVLAGIAEGSRQEAVEPWVATLVPVAVLALVAVSTIRTSEVPKARLKRVLDWSEFVAVVVMVVMVAGALGLFAEIRSTF